MIKTIKHSTRILIAIAFTTTFLTLFVQQVKSAPSFKSDNRENITKRDNITKREHLTKKDSLKSEFAIGIFWGPVWEQTTDEQYKNIKDAHVDYIQNVLGSELDTEERNLKMLDLAEKHGLKIYVADKRVKGSDADIKSMVDTYKNHPAAAGYYIVDEPDVKGLAPTAVTYNKILSFDHQKVPYVNLLPGWAVKDYEKDYVDNWIEKVGKTNLKYLSFDNYPFMIDGSLRDTYYKNLDVIRRAALKNNLKTASYLQSVGIDGAYRRPNEHELRYSAYSSVAYGIKNIVWFTYWTPTNRGEKFSNAIIDPEGNKTDMYPHFAQTNGEIKQLGKLLMDLDAVEVYHTGTTIPNGVERLPGTFFWQPKQKSDEMIITQFTHKKTGKQYIMVVNKSITSQKQFEFELQKPVKKVSLISDILDTRSSVRTLKTNYNSKKETLSDTFLPGQGKLYELK